MSKPLPTTISRYEIVGRLGQGGMGVVYRGRDPRIGRDVAIKLLHVDNEQLRERFLQEARSAGNLTHRNIVTIYDYGEHEGQPFIAMQFIDGVTLAERMRSGGIATATALRWMQELADGLGYAHDKGVVHRDIKPANVMIDRESVVRILDFGIARVEDSSLTMAGATLGTPSYMSPEQIEGRPVDRRADIFSLGVVMYEVLSGRPPFRGDTAHQIMNAVMNDTPPALVSLRPELDPAIDAVVAKAIAKDPEARYQRLSKLSADLAPIRARMPEPPVQDDDQPTGARLEHDDGHRRQQMDAYLDAADRALAQGDLAEARRQLDAALRLDPENSDVLLTQQRLKTSLFETVASVPPSLGPDVTRPATPGPSKLDVRTRPSRRLPIALVAAVVTIVAIAAAWLLWTGSHATRTDGAQTTRAAGDRDATASGIGAATPAPSPADQPSPAPSDSLPSATPGPPPSPGPSTIPPATPAATAQPTPAPRPTPVGPPEPARGTTPPVNPTPPIRTTTPPAVTTPSVTGSSTQPPPSASASTPRPDTAPVTTTPPVTNPPVTNPAPPPAAAPAPVSPAPVATSPQPVAPKPVVPALDATTAERLLTAYGAASANLSINEVRAVYPNAPDTMRQRMERMRRDFSRCDYSFRNVTVVSSTATEAIVQAETTEACKAKTLRNVPPVTEAQQFRVKKTGSGDWLIDQVFVSR